MIDRIEKQIRDIIIGKNIPPEDIPDIGLYMDQVTTFMESKLGDGKRYSDDKVMTKTMINNYTKNHLLPPSDRKKYSRSHIILMIMIYYLKNILSITDIKTVLEPLAEDFFDSENSRGISVEEIYGEIDKSYNDRSEDTIRDLMDRLQASHGQFNSSGLDKKEQRYLNDLSAICYLGYDIYIRKRLIELLVDNYRSDYPEEDRSDKKKKKPSR